ncbi:hypothetical protein OPV22_002453 [Ensete ventricosum]|uniref:Uncharacterized protein n=1 Tax=Ensete ventricosum TaxID=4639 RepID=A0AAV8RY25_ENSVE|nr:hypothetical protein OPV22_002453 [Ensete ventricosum]
MLSDVLISTPIVTGDGDEGSGFAYTAAAGDGLSGFDFGVDPNVDPDLALALRISMEEERARQEAGAKRAAEQAAEQEKVREQASSSRDYTMADPVSNSTIMVDDKGHNLTSQDDEAVLLEQALAMSMDVAKSGSASVADTDMSDATVDDQELAYALQMSVQDSATDMSIQSEMSKVLEDQSFVSSILNSLPGVDPNDPSLKDLLVSLQGESEIEDNGGDAGEEGVPELVHGDVVEEDEQVPNGVVKQGLRRLLEGIHYEVQATDAAEMGFDVIKERAK